MKYEREPEIQPAPRPSTEDAYMAWDMNGYIRDFGLSAQDAFDLARIDWQLHLEAQGWKAPEVSKVDGLDMHAQLRRAGKRGGHKGAEAQARARRCTKVKDFRGVEFDSFSEMCHRWGRDAKTVRYRLSDGWTLERALREPVRQSNRERQWLDHKGNVYMGQRAMAEAWGMSVTVLKGRLLAGWPLDKALETPVGNIGRPRGARK